MDAILLQDINGLGEAGAVVSVARGDTRNYLQPRGLAEAATPARIAEVQRNEAKRKHAEERARALAVEQTDLLGRTILHAQGQGR